MKKFAVIAHGSLNNIPERQQFFKMKDPDVAFMFITPIGSSVKTAFDYDLTTPSSIIRIIDSAFSDRRARIRNYRELRTRRSYTEPLAQDNHLPVIKRYMPRRYPAAVAPTVYFNRLCPNLNLELVDPGGNINMGIFPLPLNPMHLLNTSDHIRIISENEATAFRKNIPPGWNERVFTDGQDLDETRYYRDTRKFIMRENAAIPLGKLELGKTSTPLEFRLDDLYSFLCGKNPQNRKYPGLYIFVTCRTSKDPHILRRVLLHEYPKLTHDRARDISMQIRTLTTNNEAIHAAYKAMGGGVPELMMHSDRQGKLDDSHIGWYAKNPRPRLDKIRYLQVHRDSLLIANRKKLASKFASLANDINEARKTYNFPSMRHRAKVLRKWSSILSKPMDIPRRKNRS